MEVIQITKKQAEPFVLKKHYSRKMPMFRCAFGLVEDGYLVGVCTFGSPSAPIEKYAFKDRDFGLYELTRLVVQTKNKNAASFLIANALKLLPQPCAVVSYADTEQGHSGIVYQASNWIYTGATKSHDHLYLIDGVRTHPRSLVAKGITNPKEWAKQNGIHTVAPFEKHRYFFFCGDKRQKKAMLAALAYPVLKEYPKSEKRTYDDGPTVLVDAQDAKGSDLSEFL